MIRKHRVCPWWLGYFLLNPLRRLRENPKKVLRPFVREGMMILEPGAAMGYFTLELAQLVGASGRVVAIDIQPRMLSGLRRRLQKKRLLDRVELRLADENSLAIDDLSGKADLALLLHMAHEVPNQTGLFSQLHRALKPGGKMLLMEPRGHVTEEDFQSSLRIANQSGFAILDHPKVGRNRSALLSKS